MNDLWGEIGSAAGRIWSAFAGESKPVTLAQAKKKTKLNDTMVALALGWLAREEKVTINKKGAAISFNIK